MPEEEEVAVRTAAAAEAAEFDDCEGKKLKEALRGGGLVGDRSDEGDEEEDDEEAE